jgi:hypothetical protein
VRASRWQFGVALTIGIAFAAVVARATVGGPELAEPLGWDPVDQKVYFGLIDRSGGGEPEGLVYFDLRAARPDHVVRVPWSRGVLATDSTRVARWARVLRRLRPLHFLVSSSIVSYHVVAMDTLRSGWGDDARFRVRIFGLSSEFPRTITVTTYERPDIRLLALYQIPGRDERIAVLSFIGIPGEGGYEAQSPVLLDSPASDSVRVEWKLWQ